MWSASLSIVSLVLVQLLGGVAGSSENVWRTSQKIGSRPGTQEGPMQELYDKVITYQVTEDKSYIPVVQWSQKKGLFDSAVKLNFHGDLQMSELRRLVSVFDNNMFATSWIISQLLEVARYQDAPTPGDEQLAIAIQAIGDFHDHNTPYKTSVMNFWAQEYNETAKYYQSKPQNLVECFKLVDDIPVEELVEFLEIFGLKEIAKEIEQILKMKDQFLQAFHIPADFDDTFVNLGLGTLLYESKAQHAQAWDLWNTYNSNVSTVFDALKRYQYRPFSSDPNKNSIDPRTYMWVRPFLDEAKKSNLDVALVPTWIQNIDEVRTLYYKGVLMPFQINNVDATVAANTIFGITCAVLSGLVKPDVLDDPDIEQVYHNTSALIAFELMNNMTNRPDLALTYYPSRVEFYWFVARTFDVLDTARRKATLPRPVMESVYQMLKTSLQSGMTKYVLGMAHFDGGRYYFDDFLGDGDLTLLNKTLVRGEDRIFTTAMAVNALLYTWTWYNDSLRISHWRPGTSPQIQETVLGAMDWLSAHVYDKSLKPWNAFFSGSVKDFLSLPFWYPGNRCEYLNGTKIYNETHTPPDPFLYGMQGYMEPAEYQQQLKQRHFGLPTPIFFNGYNSGSGYFPLWSSEPYTYSSTLLAMARYNSLRG